MTVFQFPSHNNIGRHGEIIPWQLNVDELLFTNFAGGCLIIPAGLSVTTVSVVVSDQSGGTYVPLFDDQNQKMDLPVTAGQAHIIKPAIYGASCWLKLNGNAGDENIFFCPKG